MPSTSEALCKYLLDYSKAIVRLENTFTKLEIEERRRNDCYKNIYWVGVYILKGEHACHNVILN